jgi:hypothetical protein
MALTRPFDVSCNSFAALGPQLQTLATAVDSEMCDMSTAAILTGLDGPALVARHPGGVSVPASASAYSFSLSYTAPADFSNNDATLGPILMVLGGGPYVVPLTRRAWFYVGVWVETNTSAVSTRWKMRLGLEDTDPITGLITTQYFYRHWHNSAAAAGGNEHLHFGMLYLTGGGNITVALKQDSVAAVTTVGGRIWVMRVANTR